MALLWGVRDSVGPPVFFPLQLPNGLRGVSGLESTSREAQALPDKFELG